MQLLTDFASKQELKSMCPCQILKFLKPLTESEYDRASIREKCEDQDKGILKKDSVISKELFNKWFNNIIRIIENDVYYNWRSYYDGNLHVKEGTKPIQMNCVPLDLVLCDQYSDDYKKINYRSNGSMINDDGIICYKWTGDLCTIGKPNSMSNEAGVREDAAICIHKSEDNIFLLSDTKVIDKEKTCDFDRFNSDRYKFDLYHWLKAHIYIDNVSSNSNYDIYFMDVLPCLAERTSKYFYCENMDEKQLDEVWSKEKTKQFLRDYIVNRFKVIEEGIEKSKIKIEHFDTIEECQKHCPLVGAGVDDILFGSGVNKMYANFIEKYPNLIEKIKKLRDKEQNIQAKYLGYKQKVYDMDTLKNLKILDKDGLENLVSELNKSLDDELRFELEDIHMELVEICKRSIKGKDLIDTNKSDDMFDDFDEIHDAFDEINDAFLQEGDQNDG